MANRHQPALLGGLFIGILSSLPLVGGLNACCCLWVVVGGVLTTYLKQQQQPEALETADAVLAGLLAGLIGAVLNAMGAWALSSWTGPMVQESLRQALETNPQVTPEIRDFMLNLTAGRNLMLLALVIGLPMYAVFGMLGSLLGLAFFRKKTPPAAPPV